MTRATRVKILTAVIAVIAAFGIANDGYAQTQKATLQLNDLLDLYKHGKRTAHGFGFGLLSSDTEKLEVDILGPLEKEMTRPSVWENGTLAGSVRWRVKSLTYGDQNDLDWFDTATFIADGLSGNGTGIAAQLNVDLKKIIAAIPLSRRGSRGRQLHPSSASLIADLDIDAATTEDYAGDHWVPIGNALEDSYEDVAGYGFPLPKKLSTAANLPDRLPLDYDTNSKYKNYKLINFKLRIPLDSIPMELIQKNDVFAKVVWSIPANTQVALYDLDPADVLTNGPKKIINGTTWFIKRKFDYFRSAGGYWINPIAVLTLQNYKAGDIISAKLIWSTQFSHQAHTHAEDKILLTVDGETPHIVPASGERGNSGDLVSSTKGFQDGDLHYVSPKKVNSFITFKAESLEDADFGAAGNYEWNPDPATNNDIRYGLDEYSQEDKSLIEVTRDAAKTIVLKIVRKVAGPGGSAGTVGKPMNVWIVWASTPTPKLIATYPSGTTMVNGKKYVYPKYWHYYFSSSITPSSICQLGVGGGADVPDLRGVNLVHPPGGQHGTSHKWDISRRSHLHWIDNATVNGEPTVGEGHLSPSGLAMITSYLNKSLPLADEQSSYPTDPLVDLTSDFRDEENNPYESLGLIPYTNISLPVGQIGSFAVNFSPYILEAGAGPANKIVESRLHFQEFVRLEIGGKWYLISDASDWKSHIKYQKIGTKWQDSGSTSGLDNSGF